MPRTMQAVRAQTGSAPRIAPRKGGRQAKAKSKVMGKKKAEPTVAEGLKAAGKGIVNALTGNEAEASKKTTIARPAIQTTTTASPISHHEFMKHARPARATVKTIAGSKNLLSFDVNPREMATGSYGWSGITNATMPTGKGDVQVTATLNITVKHSKPSEPPRGTKRTTAAAGKRKRSRSSSSTSSD